MIWKNRIIYSIAITIISCICFFLVPNALNIMPFSGYLFYNQFNIWRIITFPFIHINISHLVQNIIAISIITLLAYEVDLNNRIYIGTFFAGSIIIAIITGLVLPSIMIAGLSMGIYSIIGSASIKGSNFIPKKILIPLFALAILIEPTAARFNLAIMKSAIFHLLGFIFGISFIIIAKKLVPKKRILTIEGE